jgi:ABC-type multidrug transport system ATPase subunit
VADVFALETDNMTKAFGRLVAVESLNLRVRVGSIHGFVGPNGSGKTTTMKMLVGALTPDSGTGVVKGHRIGSKEARRLIGYCPEHPAAYADMTALDYLTYMARLSGLDGKQAGIKAVETLNGVDLDPFSGAEIGKFSAGMKQRLGLAQAIVHAPEVLVLDEPTANLDPGGRMWLVEKLRHLVKGGKTTILISSHVLPELEQFIDALTLIHQGKLMAQDSMDALRAGAVRNRYVVETPDGDAVMAALRSKPWIRDIWLDAAGAVHIVSEDRAALYRDIAEVAQTGLEVRSFGEEDQSLEELYRKVIGGGPG